MNDDKRDELKQQLLQLKADLQVREATFKDDAGPVELDQAKVGRLSRMDAMQIQQMALDASRRRQLQLVNIDRALIRMEAGDYGYCLGCDEDIDIRRLYIDPTNSLCIHCAEKQDG